MNHGMNETHECAVCNGLVEAVLNMEGDVGENIVVNFPNPDARIPFCAECLEKWTQAVTPEQKEELRALYVARCLL